MTQLRKAVLTGCLPASAKTRISSLPKTHRACCQFEIGVKHPHHNEGGRGFAMREHGAR